MKSGFTVAILGATGAVGNELLNILEERDFPVERLRLLASPRSAGRKARFRGEELVVEAVTPDAFDGVDIAFFSAGGSVSLEFAPEAVRRGATVIDNTSAYRLDPEVPLVIPEVNAAALDAHRGMIANPNCSTVILAMALYPIYKEVGARRAIVTTFQAVSGAGARAMDELESQVHAWGGGEEMVAELLPVATGSRHYPIAFNVLPQCDVFEDEDYTKEEWKLLRETRKILGDDRLTVSATAVRVPVPRCHSESIYVETERRLTPERARELLAASPGVRVLDEPSSQSYPTPQGVAGSDDVWVGRVRKDLGVPNGLHLWAVGDQIRKGAALNAVQIAEHLEYR